MKTAISTLSAAILIATAPAVLAGNVSRKAPHHQRQISKKHSPNIYGYAPRRVMPASVVKTGYPGTFGYAPSPYTYDNGRRVGGGGAGGGGSGGGGGGGGGGGSGM
jgi:uncharacterized membrane protein YgcG